MHDWVQGFMWNELCGPRNIIGPDGSYTWELNLLNRVVRLWSTRADEQGEVVDSERDCVTEFGDDPAPGWRLLSSLPSCPNHHWRFPMYPSLLEEQRRRCGV